MVSKKIMDGVFAINKKPGLTSRQVLDQVNRIISSSKIAQESLQQLQNTRKQANGKQRIRKWKTTKLKMGHGGTLDPLASGILVIGIGSGTKKLGEYTNGSVKKYECVGLLGGSTTTGDSEGELLLKTEVDHVSKELLEEAMNRMVGTLDQTPPIFSALKMDGKRLYEYAREGLPLPREIKSREVKIYDINLKDDTLSVDHKYDFIKSEVDESGKSLTEQLANNPTLNDHVVPFAKDKKSFNEDIKLPLAMRTIENKEIYENEGYRAPLFHFDSTVSSGTYIRSLLSDIARAVGSSSYMVKLVRWKQAEWELEKNAFEIEDFTNYTEEIWAPVLLKVLSSKDAEINVRDEMEKSIKAHPEGIKPQREEEADDQKEDAENETVPDKEFKKQKRE